MVDSALSAAQPGLGKTVVMFVLAFLGAAAVSWLLLIGPPKKDAATTSAASAVATPVKTASH